MLTASEYSPLLSLLATMVAAAGVFALLGYRGAELLRALILALIPLIFVAANFSKYLIPPKIETYMPDTTLRLRSK